MIGSMPAPATPTFFVITTRGQLGPYNHAGLRDALSRGEVAVGDQVRTPFGSPLGSVGRVLQRDSQAPPPEAITPSSPQPASLPWPAIIGIGVAVVAVTAGTLVLWRPVQPVQPVPVDQPPPPVAQLATPPVAVPVDKPVEASPKPPAKPQTKPSAKTSAKPSAKALGDPFVNLLPGRTERGWNKSDGTKVNCDNISAFRISFNGKGAWAGTGTFGHLNDFTGSTGLLLVISEATAGRLTCEVVEEASRERHVASVDLAGGACEIRLPWTDFTRRLDKQDDNKPADDGLQLAKIRYLAFFPATEAPLNIRVARLALYR